MEILRQRRDVRGPGRCWIATNKAEAMLFLQSKNLFAFPASTMDSQQFKRAAYAAIDEDW